jgi:tetratricopeptide (TPR) repeat protein
MTALLGEELPDIVVGGDPVAARVAVFDRLVGHLEQVSNSVPVLAVIDDVHWADPASVAMLRHLSSTVRQARLLVLAPYRPEDAGPDTSLGAVLPSIRRVASELRLAPLNAAEVEMLARRVAGPGVVHGASAQVLAELSRGNPLFICELARLLPADWGGDVDTLPAPPGVVEVVRARLSGLTGGARSALEIASVLGIDFDITSVARALDAPVGEVLWSLGEAANHGIIRMLAPDRFAFVHPLFRAALNDALGIVGRADAHRRVAVALEAMRAEGRSVDPAALAHHFGCSGPLGSAAAAVRYAVEAGQQAMTATAFETASQRFGQALAALELDPAAADRVDLLLARADAYAAAGSREEAFADYERAAQLAYQQGRAAPAAHAALGRSGGAGMEVVIDDTSTTLIDRAIALLAADEAALRARLLARQSVILSPSGPTTRRGALVTEALEAAGRSGSDIARADAEIAWCHLHAGPVYIAERDERSQRVVAAATRAGEVRLELLGRRLRVEALLEAGRLAEVDDEITHYATRVQRVRDPAYMFYVPLWRATLAALRGDEVRYRREREALQALVSHVQGDGNAGLLANVQALFHLLDHDRDAAEAARMFEPVVRDEAVAGLDVQLVVTQALVRAADGDVDGARRLVDANVGRIVAMPQDAEWIPSMVQLADIAALGARHQLVEWLADQLAAHGDVWSVEGAGAAVRGPVARALAVLAGIAGDRSAEERAVAHARALLERSGALGWRDPRHHASTPARLRARASLRRQAEGWSIDFDGRQAYVRDSKGIRDIARLLANPGTEFAAAELVSEAGAVLVSGDAGAAIDDEARTAYRRRLAELDAELDAADGTGDAIRSAALVAERQMLVTELSRSFGLGGRRRGTGSTHERARTAVTTRIRDALKRLEAVHPAAAAHLQRAVRTGAFCAYEPEHRVDWDVATTVG